MKVGDLVKATADFHTYEVVCIGIAIEIYCIIDRIYKVHRLLYKGEIREFAINEECWKFEVINENR